MTLLLLLSACAGDTSKDDTSADTDVADTDTDTDADTDTDTDADSDTDPADASVTGSVIGPSGAGVADLELQFCQTVCYSGQTDSGGNFAFTGMPSGSYKLDSIGPTVDGTLGWIRVHVDLAVSDAYVLPAAVKLPTVSGPESFASGHADFGGGIVVTASAGSVTVPFGYKEDAFWAGIVAGTDVAAFWPVTASFGLNLLPVGSTVDAPIGVTLPWKEDGAYDVYSVDEHGSLEGPVGTATAAGGTMTATGLSPTILSLLLFVPQ